LSFQGKSGVRLSIGKVRASGEEFEMKNVE